jgi:putative chitinase
VLILTGDLLKTIHRKGCGPCPNPDETARCLRKAMDEFNMNSINRIACFLGQVSFESNEFSQLEEACDGIRYENRHDLGNVSQGDGPKYKGRGYIQLTGRANYVKAGTALDLDLFNAPELAMLHENAARIAAWYCRSRGVNRLADVMNIREITHRINGGYNDLDKRFIYTNLALKALQAEVPWRET